MVKNEKKDLIRTYMRHLIHENVTEDRNPLLFNIARTNIIENINIDKELNSEIRTWLAKLSKSHLLTETT